MYSGTRKAPHETENPLRGFSLSSTPYTQGMELIGGLVIAAIIAIAGYGLWTQSRKPKPDTEQTGVSEREWMNAIK